MIGLLVLWLLITPARTDGWAWEIIGGPFESELECQIERQGRLTPPDFHSLCVVSSRQRKETP